MQSARGDAMQVVYVESTASADNRIGPCFLAFDGYWLVGLL